MKHWQKESEVKKMEMQNYIDRLEILDQKMCQAFWNLDGTEEKGKIFQDCQNEFSKTVRNASAWGKRHGVPFTWKPYRG